VRRIVAIVLSAVALSAFGHGGEDHDAPPPPVSQGVVPRALAATEEFEVVAALEGKQLVIYVDRFASNEPVVNAKVEIEGGGLKGLAMEAAPGTYVMGVEGAMPPARHALTISIEAGDTADLLAATLDTSLPVVAADHVRNWGGQVVWSIAVLLLLVSGALLIARRNRKNAKEI